MLPLETHWGEQRKLELYITITKLLILLFLLPSCTFHFGKHEWSKTDKALFGTVVAAQIFDGVTTHNLLQDNPNNYIDNTWSWKYPSGDRPDAAEIITVKAAEILIAYIIADLLPPDYRKAFLFGTAGVLFYYGYDNTTKY